MDKAVIMCYNYRTEDDNMSKYDALWEYIHKSGKPKFTLTFEEIEKIAGVPIDHSFLKYKKELTEYGYEVKKISMKARTVLFCGNSGGCNDN